MKFILLAASILAMAVCAPHNVLRDQMFMEFDIQYAPNVDQVVPPGNPHRSLEVLLPVNAQRQPLTGPIRGFIKQEIPDENGKGTRDVFYPFGFDEGTPAAVAPVAPVAPVVPVAPVAPAAPIVPIVAARVPAARRRSDDDDDEHEDD
ncbi:secretory calcium-binding phosphoprotein 7 [Solea solea]|uniref:secretory calcium-binding phosphoprotein 7 n=1 Tax=Solea solea TaxID=90069 RepID=UPI00272CFC84|nr:secretory calcium-binding phosphoprotein 7 [Solea solea]